MFEGSDGQARIAVEAAWVERAEVYARDPEGPGEPDWEASAEMVGSVVVGLCRGKCAGGDGLTAETMKALPKNAHALLAGSSARFINDRDAE